MFNPSSEAGVDGIAQRLDAQGFAPTKAVLNGNTAEEAHSPERQSAAARPPLPLRSSGSILWRPRTYTRRLQRRRQLDYPQVEGLPALRNGFDAERNLSRIGQFDGAQFNLLEFAVIAGIGSLAFEFPVANGEDE